MDTPHSFRSAFIQQKGQYYDERTQTSQPLTKIIVCQSEDKSWLSTHDLESEYFNFRPLVLSNDGSISLLDFNMNFNQKIKRIEPHSSTMNGRYQKCNWRTYDYEQFMDNNSLDEIKPIYQDDYIKKHNIIEPMNDVVTDKWKDLYAKILRITGASDDWSQYKYHLFFTVKLALREGKLYYYISQISGDLGECDTGVKSMEFEFLIKNKEFITVKGDLKSLNHALDLKLQHSGLSGKLKRYEKRNCFKLTDYVHKWMMSGCPKLDYDLYVGDNYLDVTSITKDNMKYDFLGLADSYLRIEDLRTGEKWTFTNKRDYASVKQLGTHYLKSANDFYYGSDDRYAYEMTYELRQRANQYIDSLIHSLN